MVTSQPNWIAGSGECRKQPESNQPCFATLRFGNIPYVYIMNIIYIYTYDTHTHTYIYIYICKRANASLQESERERTRERKRERERERDNIYIYISIICIHPHLPMVSPPGGMVKPPMSSNPWQLPERARFWIQVTRRNDSPNEMGLEIMENHGKSMENIWKILENIWKIIDKWKFTVLLMMVYQ